MYHLYVRNDHGDGYPDIQALLAEKPVAEQYQPEVDQKHQKPVQFVGHGKEFQQKYTSEVFDEEIARFIEILQEWGNNPDRQLSDFTAEQREMVLAQIKDTPTKPANLLIFSEQNCATITRNLNPLKTLKTGSSFPK